MGMISLNTIVAVRPDVMAASLSPEEIVILHVETGLYYRLPSIGAEIWELVQTPRRVSDIVDSVSSAYDVDAARCEADVVALLEHMAGEQLISLECGRAP